MTCLLLQLLPPFPKYLNNSVGVADVSDSQVPWFSDIKLMFLNPQCDILALNFKMQPKSQEP